MLSVDARLTTVEGKGVGRWRLYYTAEDFCEAVRASRNLVPSCQVRVREGRRVVFGPCLAKALATTTAEG